MKNKFLNNNNVPELLAPAGSFLCLKAAVQSGANAVYLGLKKGSARMGAENFTFEELEEAVKYSHIRGARVYVALNTLFFENEIDEAYETARRAASLGIDALILQDIGLARKISEHRELFPCELHASTQMSVYNIEGLRKLKELGFSRCITARELSIDEITALCKADIMEIEVFCHGALCMSMSGQCLLSSFIGGRSGNRGSCAQPCRKKYALARGGKPSEPAYRLSPSDFASLPHIDALVRAGVSSLKIEGRLKSPAYVAMTTRAYREALDGMLDDDAVSDRMNDMKTLFSRGDFTSGYLLGKMPFEAITLRSSGRTGIPAGSASDLKRLPSPSSLPKNLIRFSFSVKYDTKSRILNKGDGFTLCDSRNKEIVPVIGGTVNAVTGECITAVGSINGSKLPSGNKYALYITDDIQLRASEEAALNKEHVKIPVRMDFTARLGELPSLTVYDDRGNSYTAAGNEPVSAALNASASEEDVRMRISKLGDTPYEAYETNICMDNGLFIPAGILNTMRRECTDALSKMRQAPLAHAAPAPYLARAHADFGTAPGGGISVFFYNFDPQKIELPHALKPHAKETCTYYIPLEILLNKTAPDYEDIITKLYDIKSKQDIRIAAYFPYISLGGALSEVREKLPGIIDAFTSFSGTSKPLIDGFMCENLGDITFLNELFEARRGKISNLGSIPFVCADHSFNITNSDSMRVLSDMGISKAAISTEAGLSQLTDILSKQNTGITPEIIVGGRIILMRSRHCYIDEGKCCGKNGLCTLGAYSLTDEYGAEFPIIPQKSDCCSILLSHKPVSYTAEQIKKIRSVCPEATLRVNVF